MRVLLRALMLLALLCGGTAVAAPPSSRTPPPTGNKAAAKASYAEGQAYVAQQDYRRALASFKRAYLAYEDPVFLFNIAQCHRLLGEREQAARYYRAFLERVPEPPNLAEVQGYLARIDRELEAENNRVIAPQGVEPSPRPIEEAPSEPVPVYKRWWLWTVVGVVVVGTAVGLGVGLSLRPAPPFNATLPEFGPAAMAPARAVIGVRF